ncbi:MAG: hypothetical protein AVDCRST_MAG64-1959 [uncultured Phycisphaerae bacterium]|uniref:DUF4177 domain-containing protein n=1 Tax=uncultured Phycisphaerae bacterium TaxID=904963 RepID=A0A6J4P3R6_9BACT|nr:MAG: hypothetical protein AVDCRST_MAG64-1959 [uncultured Phycisphaerae bacterium]
MRNVVAVLTMGTGAVAALMFAGARAGTVAAPAEAGPAVNAAQWEYRVVSTRVAPASRRETGDAGVRLVAWEASDAADADPLAKLERELNRLGGEGWDMCSAAADGTMVFRRPR